jgi:monoamine oxidase
MVTAVRRGDDPAVISHLSCWVVGRAADGMAGLSGEAIGTRVIEAIEAVRPAARGQLELIGHQAWGTDPYAGGAWAYFRPGQIRKFAAGMGRSHGRIRFCGEHLAQAGRGLEGALETAESAVREIRSIETPGI